MCHNWSRLAAVVLIALSTACVDSSSRERAVSARAESCMLCHNGSNNGDYAGPGIENPHPFPGAENLSCTQCHGGNPEGEGQEDSHVPPPPEIGDRNNLNRDAEAYFNRLTLAGIDKYPDYEVNGKTYSAIDYLQFISPGDLRVVTQGRACGKCHAHHAQSVANSTLATEVGILSGALYAAGADNSVPGNEGLHLDTAGDVAFRARTAEAFDVTETGAVPQLAEFPVFSKRNDNSPDAIFRNNAYNAANLPNDLEADGQVVTGSPLANLLHEQFAFTCGDCHLGSAGANNRYGDFRSSGCAACHMPKSLSGRALSQDPNVRRDEPRDPDQINDPELPHLRRHRIQSTAKVLANGTVIEGIDDYACAGCHQGSNRTVMQYWGIRLDQNQDLRRGVQYPANPKNFRNTRNDPRLFDPKVRNDTFNGRNENQYIRFEDYDGDGRDDTPPDVHYEAGMGCIDCHGSYDLHGGDVTQPAELKSRMEHGVAIQCENCHGNASGYAQTATGTAYDGTTQELAVDSEGHVLPHVVKEADGNFYLYSRVTGERHFVVQTHDTVVDTGKRNPLTNALLWSQKASFAMGRDDGDAGSGLGPNQGGTPTGFAHADTMDCASCHASWTNTCMGCHLGGIYDDGNNFSNITGDRIVFQQNNADFVYQSPVFFQLGVNSRNRITQTSSNTKMFFNWVDRHGDQSQIFAFSDRQGAGANPNALYPSLGHNAVMAHSIRGKVDQDNEGPRYCVACHLTRDGLAQYDTLYRDFRDDMANNRFEEFDFQEIAKHFGNNPGNQMNSPLWVHMVAGLGSGLFLFDANGCPVNPLDQDNNRTGCDDAPADVFNPLTFKDLVKFNLDRLVTEDGVPTGSSNHALIVPFGTSLRADAPNPQMAGPLGPSLLSKLTDPDTGIILDIWLNADGVEERTTSAAQTTK